MNSKQIGISDLLQKANMSVTTPLQNTDGFATSSTKMKHIALEPQDPPKTSCMATRPIPLQQ